MRVKTKLVKSYAKNAFILYWVKSQSAYFVILRCLCYHSKERETQEQNILGNDSESVHSVVKWVSDCALWLWCCLPVSQLQKEMSQTKHGSVQEQLARKSCLTNKFSLYLYTDIFSYFVIFICIICIFYESDLTSFIVWI